MADEPHDLTVPLEETILTVHFMDDASHSVQCMSDIQAGALRDLVMEGIGLPPTIKGVEMFSIWCMGDDVELELNDSHYPAEYLADWENLFMSYSNIVETKAYRKTNKKRKKSKEAPCKLYLRTTGLLAKSYERKFPTIVDRDGTTLEGHDIIVSLLYQQAREWLRRGRYPQCEVDECADLAGLALQIQLGDMEEGASLKSLQLSLYIPEKMLKKQKKGEWIRAIEAAYASQAGKNLVICQLLYLQQCRQWKTHNATFFDADFDTTNHDSPFAHPFEDGVRVAINSEGIYFMDKKKDKHLWAYDFIAGQVVEWSYTPGTFLITVKDDDGLSRFHTLFTGQGELMAEMLDAAFDDIAAEKDFIEETARRQARERADENVLQEGDPVPTRSAPEIATDGAVIMRPPPLLDDDVAYVDEDSDLIPLEDVTDKRQRDVSSDTGGGVGLSTPPASTSTALPPPSFAAEEAPAPQIWVKHFSEDHNRHYYFNSETKERSWVEPTGPGVKIKVAKIAD